MMRRICSGIVFAAITACGVTAMAQLPPISQGTVQVRLETFATGLPVAGTFNAGGPTDLVSMPNGMGNLVVTNFGGQVHLFDASGNESPTLFLDLDNPASPTYSSDFEVLEANGLVSLAFHPDFASDSNPGYGKFYTLEAEANGTGIPDFDGSIIPNSFLPHRQALYEYTLSSHLDTNCDSVCAATKRELFRVAQPGWHHNLGDLEFDEQGLLYISSGDGSTSGSGQTQLSDNSQLLSNIFGKVLRIDPLGSNSANGQYGVPADNPFVGVPGAKEEIYAYGLRNPYRLSRDPETGELWASDTGEESIESFDRIISGGNYGWNIKEGSFLYDKLTKNVSEDVDANMNGIGDVAEAMGLIDPIFEYDRADGRSAIGGAIYRGNKIVGLDGHYVAADLFNPSRLFYGDPATGGLFDFVLDPSGQNLPGQIWSVNRDEQGELYVLGRRTENADLVGFIGKLVAAIDGDFNDDGDFDCGDVDPLVAAISAATNDIAFDITNDGLVDTNDLEAWLVIAGAANVAATSGNPYLKGDANLDGIVDGVDFLEWNNNKFTAKPAWCSGDFNADGNINGGDFVIWNTNKFTSADAQASSVPEPSLPILMLACLTLLPRFKHARRAP